MTSTDADPTDAPESQEKPKLTLEVQVDSKGACQRHVTVSVAHEDVTRYIKEAFDELLPKAEVPGFRPGRAPRKLVESKFKDQILDQVKGSLLMDALAQVSDEQEFSAIGEPDFDFEAVSILEDGPFAFEFDIEVRPEFDLPDWKGLKLERLVREFTDEDVEKKLTRLLHKYSKLTERKDSAEPGDFVDVNIHVSHENQPVADHKDVRLHVVSRVSFRDTTIENFDQLIVGTDKGDARETTATISDGAPNTELRGQDVRVAFDIRGVHYLKLPALTQSFLDEIGGFEDSDELRDVVRGEMERQLDYQQQQHIRKQITDQLLRNADWDLPPELLERQSHRELQRAVLELRRSGFDDEMIQTHANRIRQNSMQATERALREHFTLERIAEEQDIDAEPEDYDAEILLIAAQQDEPPRRVRARLEKRGQMDALRNQIIERKVIDLICQSAEFTEVPPKDSDDDDDIMGIDLALAGGHDTTEIPEAKHGGDAEGLREPVDRT